MNFANKGFIASIAAMIFPLTASADSVRHLFDYNNSPLAMQTNSACGSLTLSRDAFRCNPALLRATLKNMGIVEMTTLAQESTFRALWKFATEPLTGSDVARLFSEYSFSSYSGFARFATTSPWFALEYIPFSLSGAYLISNPSLPYIKVSGTQKQAFSLTTGIQSEDFGFQQSGSFSLGMKLRFENNEYTDIDVDAISAIASTNRDFISKEKKKGLAANLGFAWIPRPSWLPNLGLTCRNCFTSNLRRISKNTLDISEMEERMTDLHLAWQWSPALGTIWSSTGLFWSDAFRNFHWEKTAAAAGYRIGELNISGAVSPARATWGFSMQREVYHISLQYAFEKQPAVFESDWKRKLYISLGAAL